MKKITMIVIMALSCCNIVMPSWQAMKSAAASMILKCKPNMSSVIGGISSGAFGSFLAHSVIDANQKQSAAIIAANQKQSAALLNEIGVIKQGLGLNPKGWLGTLWSCAQTGYGAIATVLGMASTAMWVVNTLRGASLSDPVQQVSSKHVEITPEMKAAIKKEDKKRLKSLGYAIKLA